MNLKLGLFAMGLMLLTACSGENQKPNLGITGQWHVNHGFDERCEVNAAFSETLMVLSFYSLEPGACQTGLYGIKNNGLPIRINSKTDFFAEDGSLATTLTIYAPNHGASSVLAFQSIAQGLRGSITSVGDHYGVLQTLLQQNYSLTPVSLETLDFLLGVWGAPCEEFGISEQGEFCDFIEFTESGSGRVRLIGGTSTDPNSHAPGRGSQWDTLSYVMRHFEREDDVVLFDLIIVSSNNGLLPEPLKLSVTGNGTTMTVFSGRPAGTLYRAQ